MGQIFTAEEFVKSLSAGTLGSTLILSGMAKTAGGDSDAILFSPGKSCGQWVRVPINMIERVEYFGKTPCADHDHDLVSLSLKEPAAGEAAVLAGLLSQFTPLASENQGMPLEYLEPFSASTEDEFPDALTESWNPFGGHGSGWRPPWTWSKCAKCMLGTRLVLHGAVMAAIAAAGGGTGPGAIAAAKLALAREFGAAAANLALSQVISGNLEAAAKIICRSRGKC